MIQKLVRNVYIHLPFCTKKCYYCAFPVHAVGKNTNRQLFDRYIRHLSSQITNSFSTVNYSSKLQTLYFGGGTPSLYQPSQINQIIELFSNKIDQDTEITMEFNLTQLNNMYTYTQVGINRFSLGIQTFNSQTLKTFNRQQTSFSKQKITQILVQRKIKNLNIDFIYQLLKDEIQFRQVKDFIKVVQPQHLSIYGLQVNQGSYLHKNREDARFRPFTTDEQQNSKVNEFVKRYIQMSNFLEQNGYEHYEVSAFAKIKNNDFSLRDSSHSYRSKHNAAYWRGNRNFIGFGMGASSFINNIRVTNPKTVAGYSKYVLYLKQNKQQNDGEGRMIQIVKQGTKQLLQNIIMSRLRTKQGLNIGQLTKIFNQNAASVERQERSSHLKSQIIKLVSSSINKQIQIINRYQLIKNNTIRANIPHGFLYIDLVAYKISQLISKQLLNI